MRMRGPGPAYFPAANGTEAITLSHMMAILPAPSDMSVKLQVSWSTANGTWSRNAIRTHSERC